MNKKTITSLHRHIQSAIKGGKLKMRSKKYFIMRTFLVVISIVIIAAALIYLTSFAFFVLHIRGVWELSGFGLRGFLPFLVSLPWLLFLATLVFLIGLEFLVKKTTIAYRKPLVYSVLGLMFLVLLSGFGFAKFSLHERLYNRAIDRNPPPIVGSFYKKFGDRPLHNVHPGMIVELDDNVFVMRTPTNDLIDIVILERTKFVGERMPKISDRVMIMGEKMNNKIIAEIIKIRKGTGMKIHTGLPMHDFER